MVLETAQILSTNVRHIIETNNINLPSLENDDKLLYRKTHLNHPSVKWTRLSKQNLEWVLKLGYNISNEYTHRYNKHHKSNRIFDYINSIWGTLKPEYFEYNRFIEMTKPYMAFDNKYKISDSPVKSYREYYINEKLTNAKYTNREIPEIFQKYIKE